MSLSTRIFEKFEHQYPNGSHPIHAIKWIPLLQLGGSRFVQLSNEEWAKLEINPILSEEPPVKVGKSLQIGYFKHRDNKEKIVTVLSDIWCD